MRRKVYREGSTTVTRYRFPSPGFTDVTRLQLDMIRQNKPVPSHTELMAILLRRNRNQWIETTLGYNPNLLLPAPPVLSKPKLNLPHHFCNPVWDVNVRGEMLAIRWEETELVLREWRNGKVLARGNAVAIMQHVRMLQKTRWHINAKPELPASVRDAIEYDRLLHALPPRELNPSWLVCWRAVHGNDLAKIDALYGRSGKDAHTPAVWRIAA